MKKILPLLLFPILLLGQVPAAHQNNTVHLQFSLDVETNEYRLNQTLLNDNMNGMVEIFITLELYIEKITQGRSFTDIAPNPLNDHIVPRHLTSFALLSPDPIVNDPIRLNSRLSRYVAMSDPENPREDTILEWLAPRYQQNILPVRRNISQGFGPSIRL